MGPPGAGGKRWLQWIQLAMTSALVVLFVNQLVELNSLNRKIASLYERMESLENKRMMDKTPAMEAQQRTIIQRLLLLESTVRELTTDRQADSGSGSSAPAFQLPTPPPSRGLP